MRLESEYEIITFGRNANLRMVGTASASRLVTAVTGYAAVQAQRPVIVAD